MATSPPSLKSNKASFTPACFLGWVIDRGLYSDWFGPEMDGYITAFKNREMTGAKVFEACDGVLLDDMLTADARRPVNSTVIRR